MLLNPFVTEQSCVRRTCDGRTEKYIKNENAKFCLGVS